MQFPPDEDDEQNRPLKRNAIGSELQEYFRDYCSFMYFRLVHANKPLKEVLALYDSTLLDASIYLASRSPY